MKREIKIKFGKADMPSTIGGVTRSLDHDDNYCMLINSALDDLHQVEAFLHEALHIYHRDFEDARPDAEIEADRRAEMLALMRMILEEDADRLTA